MGKLAQSIGLAPEGGKLAFGILFVGLFFLLVGFPILGAPLVLFAIVVGSFFRDPERYPERTEGVVISAADGKVTDQTLLQRGVRPGVPRLYKPEFRN